jgi:hypothetical protein
MKLFRCHECGWRGWLATGGKSSNPLPLQKKLLSFALVIITMLLVTVVTFYFTE